MACVLSRADEPHGGEKKMTIHWHELPTQVFLELGEAELSIAIVWQPDPETGVQTYLSLPEAAALASALVSALADCESLLSDDEQDSMPDRVGDPRPNGIPPYFGPDARPLEEF
ncbi:hypothetical protein [Nocardia sp. NPDC051981]|uniref:hypothetical protein n=1 Tax=Nocardia sp. NPDC051981 TaxID=3155417 RepID=UPI003438956D